MRFASALNLAVAAALVGGCAVGPSYKRPEVKLPGAYPDAAESGARSVADLPWWDAFRDPPLTGLISRAMLSGYDVRIAAARVEQARALAAQARGQLFPGIGYEANADRGRNALLGNPYTQGGGTTANGFDGYLGAAWEFDLWGRVRRLDEAARAEYLASEAARRGVMLSIVTEVATDYFQLAELNEELAIARRATQSFKDTESLFNQQLAGGTASRLDTTSAEAAEAASAAQIPALEMRIAEQANEINVLLGQPQGPIAMSIGFSGLPPAPEAPAGLPSQLLERRPDVLEAEQEARAANAAIGATIGGFLPRIGLSALLGGVSPSLNRITSGQSGLWSIGAQATGPLFQGGSLHGQYDQAKAAWEEARLAYQRTALAAFADVSNALIARKRLAEVHVQQERAVDAYTEAVRLAKQRYAAGRASYFEVLQEQQFLFPAEVALAQTRRDEYTAVIQLYKALGGGWNLDIQSWGHPYGSH